MSRRRKCQAVVVLGVGVLSVCAPVASAGAWAFPFGAGPIFPVAPAGPVTGGSVSNGSCTHDRHSNGAAGVGGDGQARTGGNEEAQCQLSGSQVIGAGVGQASSVNGIAVTNSVVNAPIQTSNGAASAAG